jgi:hypothetical protein
MKQKQQPRALARREWAGWVGEESCQSKGQGDPGAKGQGEKEPQQRWFFSGERESQEGRQPRKERGERDRKVRTQQPKEGGGGDVASLVVRQYSAETTPPPQNLFH